MLIVLSPAKRLDWEGSEAARSHPDFQQEAEILAGHMRQLGLKDLKKLMGLSDNLARLNRDRFKIFAREGQQGAMRAAIYGFAGDTYTGLEVRSLDKETLDWAQDHLRILSGLYGLLRPFDEIEEHRLEMGSRLKTRRGKSLYDFWGNRISKALNAQAEILGSDILLNCASQEYFSAVDQSALHPRVITPVFLEDSEDESRVISFFAKRARGALARFVIERRLTEPEGLADFESFGYRFDPDQSGPAAPVFRRPYTSETAN